MGLHFTSKWTLSYQANRTRVYTLAKDEEYFVGFARTIEVLAKLMHIDTFCGMLAIFFIVYPEYMNFSQLIYHFLPPQILEYLL